MGDQEIRLKCLDMALGMARAAGAPNDRTVIAETQDWLYTRTIAPLEVPQKAPQGGVKAKADKDLSLFR